MPLIPLFLAAKQAADLIELAARALEHYRGLPEDEQRRLRDEAHRVGALSSELAAVTAQSVRGRLTQPPWAESPSDEEPSREPKVIAAELRDALARFSESTAREAVVVAGNESRTVRYAATAVRFGARRLDRARAATASGERPGLLESPTRWGAKTTTAPLSPPSHDEAVIASEPATVHHETDGATRAAASVATSSTSSMRSAGAEC